MEKDNVIGFASLAKYSAGAEGQQLDYVMAGATSFIWINGRILYAYVYSLYNSSGDLDWVRTASSRWVDKIQIANFDQAASTRADSRNSGGLGFDWNRVIEKGVVGAGVGGLLVLMIGAIRGIMRLFRRKNEP